MWIDYTEKITEQTKELIQLQARYRGSPVENRIRMLLLLKSGKFRSQCEVAPILGYSDRQLRRWWNKYHKDGIDGILEIKKRGGNHERATEESIKGLKNEIILRQGMISLEEARQYLIDEWNIFYKSTPSISVLLKRHKIKKKTGRKRHKKSDLQAQADFKK